MSLTTSITAALAGGIARSIDADVAGAGGGAPPPPPGTPPADSPPTLRSMLRMWADPKGNFWPSPVAAGTPVLTGSGNGAYYAYGQNDALELASDAAREAALWGTGFTMLTLVYFEVQSGRTEFIFGKLGKIDFARLPDRTLIAAVNYDSGGSEAAFGPVSADNAPVALAVSFDPSQPFGSRLKVYANEADVTASPSTSGTDGAPPALLTTPYRIGAKRSDGGSESGAAQRIGALYVYEGALGQPDVASITDWMFANRAFWA